jgi:hypothetical protein
MDAASSGQHSGNDIFQVYILIRQSQLNLRGRRSIEIRE